MLFKVMRKVNTRVKKIEQKIRDNFINSIYILLKIFYCCKLELVKKQKSY